MRQSETFCYFQMQTLRNGCLCAGTFKSQKLKKNWWELGILGVKIRKGVVFVKFHPTIKKKEILNPFFTIACFWNFKLCNCLLPPNSNLNYHPTISKPANTSLQILPLKILTLHPLTSTFPKYFRSLNPCSSNFCSNLPILSLEIPYL